MAGLCEGGNEPPDSLKASVVGICDVFCICGDFECGLLSTFVMAVAIVDLTYDAAYFVEVHRVDRPPGHGQGFQPPCRNVDRGYCPKTCQTGELGEAPRNNRPECQEAPYHVVGNGIAQSGE
ncbi:hypothetical protein ANN_05621 [Periplaneta americana]|uniref:Uncharacterized protein n=1 Tax=Periplaneta americana TaxID=6978 RepID=A0ABQ8TBC0_PERAM|nr:hypothetical protein ANN_05621 [Periplaneta americana]